MKKIIYTTFCSIFIVAGLIAQEKKIKKASQEFENYAYVDAINSYENLLEKGYSKEEIYKKLGNANYLNANYEVASEWFKKLFDLENTEIESDYYYRYAQSLKSLQNYKESDIWMNKFAQKYESDTRAINYTQNQNYLEEIEKNSGRYRVEITNMNSEVSDFAPSFYNDGLIFSSARGKVFNKNRIHNWNKQLFLNLYTATTEDDTSFSINKIEKKINSKAHESSTVVSKDGKNIYFTRNNYDKGFGRDDEGVSRLKLFKATIDGDNWKNIEEMSFNSKEYSVAHPALNADNTKLFFSSDMPGTIGASDIFYVDLNEDGSYGDPINLGRGINTEGRETFPFVAADDILYFSSDGRPGLGGLDVFATNILMKNTSTTKVVNLGQPINTDEDDFSFIVNQTGEKGYFASNRPNGVGDDDIYSFTTEDPLIFECESIINGIVKDKETGEILANANVEILSSSGEPLGKGVSDTMGVFSIAINCDAEKLTAIGVKKDYKEDRLNFVSADSQKTIELFLTPDVTEVIAGDDLSNYLEIPVIYFDFDKWNIRPDAQIELQKVISYLQQYPINLEISSHTDSRGNKTYNEWLSSKRAESTRAYLISKGIKANRLTSQGYGENKLTNKCSNDVACSEEEHQKNRRTEFIVVK